MDANSDLLDHNSWLQSFIRATQLSDTFTLRHGCEINFPTFKRGSTRIDYMMASQDLLPFISASGYLPFDSTSDHRLMFTDVDAIGYLRDAPPPLSDLNTPRTILSRYKKLSKQYKAQSLGKLHTHKYYQRITALTTKVYLQESKLTDGDKKELESIDRLITNSMIETESEHVRIHSTPWSPALLQNVHTLAYWAAWISELRTRKDLSTRREYRIEEITKLGGDLTAFPNEAPTLAEARQKQRQSCKALRVAKKNAKQLREDWLLEQEDISLTEGNKTRAQVLKTIRKAETMRRTHQVVRSTLSGRAGRGLSSVIITNPETGEDETVFDPADITTNIIARNMEHFHQADGTPFTTTELQAICKNPFEMAIKQLHNHTGYGNASFDAVISELSNRPAAPDPMLGLVDGNDLTQKFRRWKESTSTSPSKRHLGLYRAILKAPNPHFQNDDDTESSVTRSTSSSDEEDHGAIFFNFLAQIINVCVNTGYVLSRWRKVASVMLEKIPNRPVIEKLRVIHLFEADLNAWTGIVFGRRMMHKAEALEMLGEEQGGSRKGRTATDVYAMKFLSFQMAELTRTPLAVMDNDAKACYDRIVMALASQRCEQIGIPHDACQLLENFLDSAHYHISTTLGVSEQSYRSTTVWKLHGPGQGNQCSPAIWAVVSTLILNTMKSKFPGTTFSDPQSTQIINHHMQAFVDDSSIWVNDFKASIKGTCDDNHLLLELQSATQWWEKLLVETGGMLELRKCFYYFIKWQFDQNGAATLDTDELPQKIIIKQSTSKISKEIPRKMADESHRTLGFQTKPVNDYKDQLQVLQSKSNQVTRALYSHKLDSFTAQTAYHSVFAPRILYALPMCGISAPHLNTVQSGPLNYTLRSMGYPKSFPRAMVFLSQEDGGVGFSALFKEQGIANTLFLIRHLRQQTQLGKFLIMNLRWMQHIAGTSFLLLRTFHNPLPYIPSTWLHSLRTFLNNIDAQIYIEDERPREGQRHHDQFIMDSALQYFTRPAEWEKVNRVRIFLQVTRLSDIVNIAGTHLVHPYNFQMTSQEFPSRTTELWPVQTKPGKSCWVLWGKLLQLLTTDGHKL